MQKAKPNRAPNVEVEGNLGVWEKSKMKFQLKLKLGHVLKTMFRLK